jgi:tRNA A-37 threonylcarbamoyl transferase component Bud32
MVIHSVYALSSNWERVGALLDDIIRGPYFRVIKSTHRTLAGATTINGVEVFVKRVNNESWLKGLTARVCGSHARRTVRGARLLRCVGCNYPSLLAVFEQRRAGSVAASYLVTEYLRRPKTLSRVALADGRDYMWRRRLSKLLAQTVRTLHNAGCYTRDLQETNLMLDPREDMPTIIFTDLEDFRWLPAVPWYLRLRNLLQLDRSIGRFVSRTHRLRFLRDYLGDNLSRAEVRSLVVRLHRMRHRAERKKLRRKRPTAIITPCSAPL